jgi:hypothetical protein
MTARFFADTNIAVYTLDANPARRRAALSVMKARVRGPLDRVQPVRTRRRGSGDRTNRALFVAVACSQAV